MLGIHTKIGFQSLQFLSGINPEDIGNMLENMSTINSDIQTLQTSTAKVGERGLAEIVPVTTTSITEDNGMVLGAFEKNPSVVGSIMNLMNNSNKISSKVVTPNTNLVSNSIAGEFSGMVFSVGNFATVYIKFSKAYFISGEALCNVPKGFRPKADSTIIISARRVEQKSVYFNTYCTVHTNGNIAQTFNSDGANVPWEGTIYGCYEIG